MPIRHPATIKRLRFALCLAVCTATATVAQGAQYSFLPVTATGTFSSQFTSGNNGVINVSHTFSSGGVGGANNQNNLIFPSQFTTLFPGTGQVQGHLVQTVYNHSSVVTFDMTGYTISPTTIFGIWNTTDEIQLPAYRVQLIDGSNNQVSPTTFLLYGNQDNQTQVSGRHQLVMNTLTGDLGTGALLNAFGTHTDAAFWYNIPTNTKQIIVYGNLGPLNNIGDGVGYYFAEVVPEPSSIVLAAGGLVALGTVAWRKCRRRGAR